jgi:predicted RNA-binding Zn-ribbon protein involved in translation (DUF1610 family)
MQDMFENAKRVASTAVERAAWEADRMRRIGARQRELELTDRERTALLHQLGDLVLDLDRRQQLTQEPLRALAARLRTLREELERGQADIQAIRNEAFTPGTVAITVAPRHDPDSLPCPTCGQLMRKTAAYCSACGARLH